MRIYVLYALIAGAAAYAWRNWFASFTLLIVLLAVIERKDFPYSVAGIQGLNPWNVLLTFIILARVVTGRAQGCVWDMPRGAVVLALVFIAVLTLTVVRGFLSDAGRTSTISYWSYHWINPLKFLLLGALAFDGARTRRRVLFALLATLAVVVIWALLTIRFVPLSTLMSDSDFMRYRYRFDRDIGIFATSMGMVLAGGFWAVLALWPLTRNRLQQLALLAAAGLVLTALGLTHARGAYATVVALGLVFAFARWRRLLILLPLGLVVVLATVPSIGARVGMGFGVVAAGGESVTNFEEVTSGRSTYLWPYALEEIQSRPLLGAGRQAILHTPMYDKVVAYRGSCPNHPHNAYLELMMDAGIVGVIPVLAIYVSAAWLGLRLFRVRGDPLAQAVGGAALAFSGMLLIAGLGSQSFFELQVSTTPIFLTAGLALRVSLEHDRQRLDGRIRRRRGFAVRRRHG